MNRSMASKVACCEPVASSPETWVRAGRCQRSDTIGMPPVTSKKLVQRIGDVLLIDVQPAAEVRAAKAQCEIEIGMLAS